ncbi:MAG: hypothetical protein IKD89_06130 [Clostridia bacterium]|nr:hypothetical protein [Clostridia bacterium]
MEYNYNLLRADILFTLETFIMQGFPQAQEAFDMAEKATNEELLTIAEDMEFDLSRYPVPRREDLWLPENKRIRFKDDK